MEPGPDARSANWRSLAYFGAGCLAGAAPFWLVGPLLRDLSGLVRSPLPAAALSALVPAAVAVVLSWREGTLDVLRDRLRTLAGPPRWWLASVLVAPAVVLADAWWHADAPWTLPDLATLVVLTGSYLVAAIGEELGWSGYAAPRLLDLMSPAGAATLLGAYWLVWHLVPLLQTGHPAGWVVGQSLQTFALRGLLVALAAGSGVPVWTTVAAHALTNIAWSLSPAAGRDADPWTQAGLLLLAAAPLLALAARAPRPRGRRAG